MQAHLVSFVALALGVSSAGAQAPRNAFLLVGANVETGAGQTFRNAFVAVEGERIVYVGPTKPTKAYTEVSATGLWVYPGFMDPFVTRGLSLPPAKENAAVDTTTTAPPTMLAVNNKGVRPQLVASELLDNKTVAEDLQTHGFTHYAVMPGVGLFRGQAGVIDAIERTDANKSAIVRRASAGMGMSLSGGPGQGYPGSAFAQIALIRQTFYDALRYGEAVKADPKEKAETLEGLQPLVTFKAPAIFQVDSTREIERAFTLQDEFGFNMVLAQARDAGPFAAQLIERRVPIISSMVLGVRPSQNDRSPIPEPILAEQQAEWDARVEGLVTLAKTKGLQFALSNQGDNASAFFVNLHKAIEQGIPKDVALRAITLGPAEIYGISAELGTIEVGKRANLTILTKEFTDPNVTVHGVVIGGQYLPKKKAETK